MLEDIKAVIFDMDGVVIDSEPLWRRAMVEGFKQFNMPVSENDCRKTMGKRIGEVVIFWMNQYQINNFTAKEIESTIISILIELIQTEGKLINGVLEVIQFCKIRGLKIGLATSSSELLMNTVLKKFELNNYFNVTISAQRLKYAKPHPEVFLICAEKLGIPPDKCIVIEDSLTGAIAAKSAQMKLIVVPDSETKHQEKFNIADYHLKTMLEVLQVLKIS